MHYLTYLAAAIISLLWLGSAMVTGIIAWAIVQGRPIFESDIQTGSIALVILLASSCAIWKWPRARSVLVKLAKWF